MQRTRLAALSLAAVVLASCIGIPRELENASVVAYWSASHPGALRCTSSGHGCAEYFTKIQDLDQAVTDQRTLGNELVRLDAIRMKTKTIYVGVWQPHPPAHQYETTLSTQQFQDKHAALSATHRLEGFSVWQDVNSSRIAAVWRPRTAEESGLPPDQVEIGLKLSDFPRTKAGFYIDEIELYPPEIAGDPPAVAVVWRPGEIATQVLHGSNCELGEPITASVSLPGSCTIDGDHLSTPSQLNAMCPALQAVEAQYALGFRAADFEHYVEAGEQRLAILLQDIGDDELAGEDDWLMMPAEWKAVNCRHEDLGPPSDPELRLLDLDIMPLDSWTRLGQETHNGLVHDSGTGGPP